MSGHSKWHNIQAKKGKADAARGNIFTKLAKAIAMAAQTGGGDPTMNFSLRLAVDKAKAANMPKDNIEKAIKRGTGEGKDGVIYQELLYEGFGPGGVAILIAVVTDNNNRSVSEIKGIMNKLGGTLGGPGSVKWQFENMGVFLVGRPSLDEKNINKDDFSLKLMDAGVKDIKESEEGLEIICPRENFQAVSEAISSVGLTSEDSGLQWLPKETVEIDAEKSETLDKLIETLEEFDDVDAVYTNAT